MCEHSVLYCVFGLSVFSSFFPFRSRIVKWTNEHTDTHKRLECTHKHRTKTHLFIVVILSMNNNKKTINNENTSRRIYTLHMEFSTMLLDYVIYELENLNTRFWRYSILFFFDQAKAIRSYTQTQISNSTGGIQQTEAERAERCGCDGDMRGRKKNAPKTKVRSNCAAAATVVQWLTPIRIDSPIFCR